MPGDFRCDRGDYARVFVFYHTRGCGRIERPAFPAPSEFLGGWFLQELGRIAPRGRGRMLVIARSDLSAVAQRAKAEATKQSISRHFVAMRSIEPGISRFPDVQLHI